MIKKNTALRVNTCTLLKDLASENEMFLLWVIANAENYIYWYGFEIKQQFFE